METIVTLFWGALLVVGFIILTVAAFAILFDAFIYVWERYIQRRQR